jgi:hypothetical protein
MDASVSFLEVSYVPVNAGGDGLGVLPWTQTHMTTTTTTTCPVFVDVPPTPPPHPVTTWTVLCVCTLWRLSLRCRPAS